MSSSDRSAATTASRLVLEIEIPGFYVEGNEAELVEEWGGTLLDVVTEEWMRSDVGLTLVSIPGEKNLNSDFEVHAMNGRIVGARIVKEAEPREGLYKQTVTKTADLPITEERPRDVGAPGAAT